jgi:tol-pal system protein YbgF
MRQGEWDKAVEGYQEFLRYCPNHEKVESALYWSGESYYSLEKYAEAIEQFEKLTEEFKGSNLLSAALYKMARSHQELGQKDQARSIYQRLTKEFEGTLEAQQAKERLKDL